MIEIFLHTVIDNVKLLPFLFFTYLIMEFVEHKFSQKQKTILSKSNKYGPVLGGILGGFPQCGFSVMASNLFAGGVITVGTLVAVFLSTSDEMLAILISKQASIKIIIGIILIKIIIGIISGILIDLFSKKNKENINKLCEEDHCHCEKSIIKSSLIHTITIFIYIFIFSLLVNTIVHVIGEDTLSNLLSNNLLLDKLLIILIGLIPNCFSSILITELFLNNLITIGTVISGLLVGSGVGLLILFKVNKNIKENIKIVLMLIVIALISGIIIDIFI